jgi:hexosaminidase
VKFILSPANKVYIDMKYHEGTALGLAWAGHVEVRDAYDRDPATALPDVPESALLGVEAPLWSETLVHIHEFEHTAFPRLPAIAEIGRTPAARVAGTTSESASARRRGAGLPSGSTSIGRRR